MWKKLRPLDQMWSAINLVQPARRSGNISNIFGLKVKVTKYVSFKLFLSWKIVYYIYINTETKTLVCTAKGSRSSLIDIATTLRAGRSGARIPVRDKGFLSSPKRPDRLWHPPSLLFNGYRVSFQGVKRPRREVDHFPLVRRLKISGVIPLLPLYAFMAWTRKNFSFTFIL
jgi:hypothetical protein